MPKAQVFKIDGMELEQVKAGLTRSAIRSEQSIHTFNWFEPGFKSSGKHSHPFDQVSYVLSGTLRFFVGDEVFDLSSPSVLYIPANIPHGAEPLGDERVLNIDVFSPIREDYLYLADHQNFED
jgi:mannose-6-phosphate isomerase-like protein (cupin superfamily)